MASTRQRQLAGVYSSLKARKMLFFSASTAQSQCSASMMTQIMRMCRLVIFMLHLKLQCKFRRRRSLSVQTTQLAYFSSTPWGLSYVEALLFLSSPIIQDQKVGARPKPCFRNQEKHVRLSTNHSTGCAHGSGVDTIAWWFGLNKLVFLLAEVPFKLPAKMLMSWPRRFRPW